MEKAVIYKGIGGFYYVKTARGEMLECKPRGVFRKEKIKPLAGDEVIIDWEAGTPFISKILPRKNFFVRPPIANVDKVFIVASMVQPKPDFYLLDKLSVQAIYNSALPVIVLTKTDLASPKDVQSVYSKSKMDTITIVGDNAEGLAKIRSFMANSLSFFCGNSGVGKSTLMNALLPEVERETAEISQKLGRGRHTTREVEIFEAFGGLLADTPGFSDIGLHKILDIEKENIQWCFPEFEEHIPNCRFSNCSHTSEIGCAVLKAVENLEISKSRHNSYALLYEEVKQARKY